MYVIYFNFAFVMLLTIIFAPADFIIKNAPKSWNSKFSMFLAVLVTLLIISAIQLAIFAVAKGFNEEILKMAIYSFFVNSLIVGIAVFANYLKTVFVKHA